MDLADIDILLVGDSASMVIHGHDTTLPITLEEMLVHCRSVARGAKNTFLVGDIPFGSYESSDENSSYQCLFCSFYIDLVIYKKLENICCYPGAWHTWI